VARWPDAYRWRVPDESPPQMLTRCACVAAWGTAVLRGAAPPDRALDAMRSMGIDASFATDEDPSSAPVSFTLAVGSWRSRGITGWRYVPVAPGDSQGLPGPEQLRARALDAGAALVSTAGPAIALLPDVVWNTAHAASPRTLNFVEVSADGRAATAPESLAELDGELLRAVTEVTEHFDQLDVASWREEVADLMNDWDQAPDLPPGAPVRVLALVDLATDDHGGSRTAREMSLRAEHLRTLTRVARAAHAAAWNAAGGAIDPRG
jgi:hypothetical protein